MFASVFSAQNKIRLTYLLIFVGWLILTIGTFFVANYAGPHIAKAAALEGVKSEINTAISLVSRGHKALVSRKLTDADIEIFNNVIKYSDILNLTLYAPSGQIIWESSQQDKLSYRSQPVRYFSARQRLGKTEVDFRVLSGTAKATTRKDTGQFSEKVKSLAIVLVPLIVDGQFRGAIEATTDTTAIHKWATEHVAFAARIAAIVTAIALGVMFLVLVSYHRERSRKELELQKSNVLAQQKVKETEVALARLSESHREIDDLNKELSDKISKLNETRAKLIKSAKMAQLGNLTSTIAHELRNPLVAVRTSVFIAKRKVKGMQLGLEKPIQRIEKGIERCTNVISELLEFSETKQARFASRPINEWIVATIENQAKELPESVRFECTLDTPDSLEVEFDATMLEHALANLFRNSCEAMQCVERVSPEDEQTVAALIKVRVGQSARGLEISVCDTGPGLDQTDMDEIMEPLYTTKSFGVGLGLPAAAQVLERHQGGLEPDRDYQGGAKFVAWLPLHQNSVNDVIAEAA